MIDKLMYTPNEDTLNYPFSRLKRLDTQLIELTNQNSIKALKVLKANK